MDMRRTSGHSVDCGGATRSQLRIHAFHASCKASAPNPGSSDQRTGTQRLLPCSIGGGNGPASSGVALPAGGRGAADEEGAAGIAGSGGSGTLPQAASIPTMAASHKTRDNMLLILLEALLALLLLVGIVWWTMFSGRKGGEPPPIPEEGGLPDAEVAKDTQRTQKRENQ